MSGSVATRPAVITALVDDRQHADRAWPALRDAAHTLGLTIVGERALAPIAHELVIAWPPSGAEPEPDAGATPRDHARRLRRELTLALAACAPGLVIDLAVQLDRPSPRAPRLLIMDMDSTIITIEVIDELARRHGVGAEVSAITARAMAGELDFEASLRARVGRLAGLPASVLDDIAATLPLTDGAARLVAAIHARGGWVALVSGGFTFAADALAARLGLDHAHANVLAIADDHLTGAVAGAVVTPVRKAALVDELAVAHGLDLADTVAIGDGANDLLMLERAGLGVAFHGKPRLAAAADAALSAGGLDRTLYVLGLSDDDLAALGSTQP